MNSYNKLTKNKNDKFKREQNPFIGEWMKKEKGENTHTHTEREREREREREIRQWQTGRRHYLIWGNENIFHFAMAAIT